MGEDKPAERVERLEPLIFTVRRQRVILDADLARLYGVGTKRFNEAFKRNRRRFPDDFAFQLTAVAFAELRSQFEASSPQLADRKREIQNWSQFATSSASRRGRTYRPWAFTEHGALMAANILRSEQAVRMNPSTENFFGIVKALQKKTRTRLRVAVQSS